MTCEELQNAIATTLTEINEIKQQIAQATDHSEKRRLIKRKRELQYLQLWYMDLLQSNKV